jgi:hypothetical protein
MVAGLTASGRTRSRGRGCPRGPSCAMPARQRRCRWKAANAAGRRSCRARSRPWIRSTVTVGSLQPVTARSLNHRDPQATYSTCKSCPPPTRYVDPVYEPIRPWVDLSNCSVIAGDPDSAVANYDICGVWRGSNPRSDLVRRGVNAKNLASMCVRDPDCAKTDGYTNRIFTSSDTNGSRCRVNRHDCHRQRLTSESICMNRPAFAR